MEKLSQTLVSQISKLQRRLESFLENDFETQHEENDKTQKAFEPSLEQALIRGVSVGLPEDHVDRAVVLFSRLGMFFDSGVLLENHDGLWKAQACFHKGVTQLLKTQHKSLLRLPHVSLLTVLKTSPVPLLKKLHLQHLDPENKTSCLLIKASNDFSFLLFSSLPDMWLKDHIENIRGALISGFAD